MPVPSPNKGEKEADFISRCMGDSAMNKEYPDNKQRSAVCYSQFKKNEESLGLDEKGRIIIAENVPLLFNCTIGEKK